MHRGGLSSIRTAVLVAVCLVVIAVVGANARGVRSGSDRLDAAGGGSHGGNPPAPLPHAPVQNTPTPRFIPKKAAAVADHVLRVVFLLFLSAMFAGLTMGIMGCDCLSLEIIAESGPKPDCNYAQDILPIRRHGHQTLCTLILANMLANVMIVQELNALQTSLFSMIHKWPQRHFVADDNASAIWSFIVSTLIILIFTEILPMSLCKSKHSLRIASAGIPLVRLAMVLTWPVAMPLGWLLDVLLPHGAGQIYDRNELKKLMMLHYEGHGEKSGLQDTELQLMLAAMEFHEKLVKDVMTPVDRVFSVAYDEVVTPQLLERLWRSGRSRVPVVGSDGEFCDVLLVRDLITFSRGPPTVAAGGGAVTVGEIAAMKTRNVPSVDETTPLPSMLVFFQRVNTHMAIVHRIPKQATTSPDSSNAPTRAPSEGGGSFLSRPQNTSSLTFAASPQTPTAMSSRRLSLASSNVFAPAEDGRETVGIITLEDVVEELIRDEIYDEYDSDNVFEEDDNPTLASTAPQIFVTGIASLSIPRPPRRRPRVNFFSYYVHEDEDVELNEGQVWAAAYYLVDMCPMFKNWRIGYVKYLLDQIGSKQMRPFPSPGAAPAQFAGTPPSAVPDSLRSSPIPAPAPHHPAALHPHGPAGTQKKRAPKRLVFHERHSISGNLPARKMSLSHFPPLDSHPSAALSSSRGHHNMLQEENHRLFAESAASESMVLYRRGEAAHVMTVVLSGSVDILLGRDGFISQLRSFRTLGDGALMSELYVPEFTAVVRVPTRLYQIPRDLYDALMPAATFRRVQMGGRTSSYGAMVPPPSGPRLIANRASWANLSSVGAHDDGIAVQEDASGPTSALLMRGKAYGTFGKDTVR